MNFFSPQNPQPLRRASLGDRLPLVFYFFISMYRVFVVRQRLSSCPLWRVGSSPGRWGGVSGLMSATCGCGQPRESWRVDSPLQVCDQAGPSCCAWSLRVEGSVKLPAAAGPGTILSQRPPLAPLGTREMSVLGVPRVLCLPAPHVPAFPKQVTGRTLLAWDRLCARRGLPSAGR